MNNQEAEVKVAQEVPFITGQYTSTTSTSSGTISPFQTIQREEVGTILKVTPHINEGDAVHAEDRAGELRASRQAPAMPTASSPTSASINTTVLIEDGGIVVLGGLIQDSRTKSEHARAAAGQHPAASASCSRRAATSHQKTNLWCSSGRKILRDDVQTATETNAKYNYIRNEQSSAQDQA